MPKHLPPPIPEHPDALIDSQSRAYAGRYPVDVITFRNRRFDGQFSAPRTWQILRRGQAVAMLPYDPITDTITLIEQFRFPALVANLDPVLIELPAGLLEPDEDPDAAMRRELQEEMALATDRMEKIGTYILSAGGSDETCVVYAGRVTAPVTDPDGYARGTFGLAEEQEDIRVRVYKAKDAMDLAFQGRITNAIAAIALYWFAAQHDRLRREWSPS
jgi:ADP-ribose pyrophosphatase